MAVDEVDAALDRVYDINLDAVRPQAHRGVDFTRMRPREEPSTRPAHLEAEYK
jgi:hypothetical protein